MDSEALIVGAGPTGLTLAIDLGKRGVRCTLIEQKAQPTFLPKMERINARTMEAAPGQIQAASNAPSAPTAHR